VVIIIRTLSTKKINKFTVCLSRILPLTRVNYIKKFVH